VIFAFVLFQMLKSAAIGRVAGHPGLHSDSKEAQDPVRLVVCLAQWHVMWCTVDLKNIDVDAPNLSGLESLDKQLDVN
jgi:hypothetical protein